MIYTFSKGFEIVIKSRKRKTFEHKEGKRGMKGSAGLAIGGEGRERERIVWNDCCRGSLARLRQVYLWYLRVVFLYSRD